MTKQHPLVIGIPTINQWPAFKPAVEDYIELFPDCPILIVDNGAQNIEIEHPAVAVMPMFVNLGVAGSWNLICNVAFKYLTDRVLMLNDDIHLGSNLVRVLQHIKEANLDETGLATSLSHWYSFLITKKCFKQVGKFDELFYPAYFEDNDYHYRFYLKYGYFPPRTDYLEPSQYVNSASIKKDPSLNGNFEANKKRYIKKWGGEPGKETYTKPFNQ